MSTNLYLIHRPTRAVAMLSRRTAGHDWLVDQYGEVQTLVRSLDLYGLAQLEVYHEHDMPSVCFDWPYFEDDEAPTTSAQKDQS